MIVSISQPGYFPWLGFFDRILKSDVVIILDHVQLEKNSFVPRNKIRKSDGWLWLTVPVIKRGRFGNLPINQVEINRDTKWAEKHAKTIKNCYSRAPFFAEHIKEIESILENDWFYMSALLERSIQFLMKKFEIERRMVRSSELRPAGRKADLVVELCQKVGATQYISGPLGRSYLTQDAFLENGIDLLFHDYEHPVYTQTYEGFEPYMSGLDLLLNHGPASVDILKTSNQTLSRT